ncbi:MAG: GTPase HflX [Sediminibacterium sp.]|nr:GTPase HflX [Sediminibacterium sp.]
MIEQKQLIQQEETAVLVGIVLPNQTIFQVEEFINELAFLAETAGAKTIEKFIQKLAHPDSKTYIGIGKLKEIADYVEKKSIQLVIFDDELSGSQLQNIKDIVKVNVIDRNSLILDIFARRAQTAQAKVQVELAQYQYLLPRLKGFWSHLERQGGGIGTRGPGETEIETDRRIVKDKISLLKKQLEQIDKQSFIQRKERNAYIRVSLVGYTNVGKSTLMNTLSKSDVFAENKLFATLDTTTRKIVWNQIPFLLSDTVGFIRKLPHHLIESFKTTLHEVKEADLLIHVVDFSHSNYEDQIKVVHETLKSLDVLDKPKILVLNKLDLFRSLKFDEFTPLEVQEQILEEVKQHWDVEYHHCCLMISATQKEQIQVLKDLLLEKILPLYQKRFPYQSPHY